MPVPFILMANILLQEEGVGYIFYDGYLLLSQGWSHHSLNKQLTSTIIGGEDSLRTPL